MRVPSRLFLVFLEHAFHDQVRHNRMEAVFAHVIDDVMVLDAGEAVDLVADA